MARFIFDWRRAFLWLVLFAALLGGIFLFLRRGFDPNDVVTEFAAPSVASAGEEGVFTVVVRNGSGVPLKDVRIILRFPTAQGVASEPHEEVFGDIPSREQQTREISLVIPTGQETVKVLAVIRFRAGVIPAAFEKTHEEEIFVSAAPIDLSFSFPSDVRSRQSFTFFVRWRSLASGTIPRIGLRFTGPSGFEITRTRPDAAQKGPWLWNLGDLSPDHEGEIAVTGVFSGDPVGEFVAELGTLNESGRDLLLVLKEAREFRKFAQADLAITLKVQDVENPGEVILLPGETAKVVVEYQNTSGRSLEDVSVVLGFAHPSLNQEPITASPPFQRRPSGEYAWTEGTIPAFSNLAAFSSGQITFLAALNSTISMTSFKDANQSIPLELRVFAEGKLQAERATLVKIGSRLKGAVQAYIREDPDGYDNSGPVTPRVGQKTTTTLHLVVIGGTNGFRTTSLSLVLSPKASFEGVVSSDSASVRWNPDAREFVWNIADLIAGTGILSPPRELVIRLGVTPDSSDIGKPARISDSGLLVGEDSWTGRTSDFTFEPASTVDIADPGFVYRDGIVQE